jgi:hypothetical protein
VQVHAHAPPVGLTETFAALLWSPFVCHFELCVEQQSTGQVSDSSVLARAWRVDDNVTTA